MISPRRKDLRNSITLFTVSTVRDPFVALPVSPRCGRSLPEFCPDQTLCCWPTARCLGPAAASTGPSPCAAT